VMLLDAAADGFDSYLQTLYLLPGVTGGGIGRELLVHAARMLAEQGRKSMALRVLVKNPARRFYERLGARVVPEGLRIDEGQFDDLVYAFDDVGTLLPHRG
jgi:ribosomal protein S18 acetylase RimI-like enzyme